VDDISVVERHLSCSEGYQSAALVIELIKDSLTSFDHVPLARVVLVIELS
jgi:hypothetical protein